MHQQLNTHLNPDAIEVCTSADNCDPRRKPNPGMLLDAANELQIDLRESFMVGDRDKDIIAGKRAGVTTILLLTEYNQQVRELADYCCTNYAEIIEVIRREAK